MSAREPARAAVAAAEPFARASAMGAPKVLGEQALQDVVEAMGARG